MKEKRLFRRNLWTLWIMWEPRDLWVGVFWKQEERPLKGRQVRLTDIYVCLLPCIPIRLSLMKFLPIELPPGIEEAIGHRSGCPFLMYDQSPCGCGGAAK